MNNKQNNHNKPRNGGMMKETLVRQAAHNLHERREIQALLNEPKISNPRKQYLRNQLTRLNREKAFFLRIANDPAEGFRINEKDCFKI